MIATRRGLAVGLATTAAVACWALPQLAAPSEDALAVWSLALAGLWTSSAIGAALLGPWIAAETTLRRAGVGMAMLVLTPLPFLSVAWLGGAASAAALARGLFCVATIGSAGLAASRAARGDEVRGQLLAAGLAGLLAAGVWASRAEWLAWIGR